jgi:uncharacterized RDD family membrane protein YckC/RNA polymerase subunit RPABC4/transcription elongation factor Spt4
MAQTGGNHSGGQTTCSSCRRPIPENAQFCPYCGYPSEIKPGTCAHCGAALTPDLRFCPICGSAAASTATEEAVEAVGARADAEYMGFWIRMAAWLIDVIVLSIIQFVLEQIGLSPVAWVIGIPYAILFIGLKGQTPGKIALGIQVVDRQGNIPGIGRAILREIVGKLASAIVILLGFLWISWDRNKRGWHDHIGGTYVVRKRRDRVSSS